MPVRVRITLLFAFLVMIILSLVCGGIYYFSYTAREDAIRRRLTNRAITTARLLGQREIFDQKLVQRIDSLTTLALKHKTVQAYDYQNKKIYSYSDVPFDTLHISEDVLDDARVKGSRFIKVNDKEAVAYHYSDENTRIVVVSAAEDVEGKESLNILRNILLAGFLVGTTFVLVTGYIFSARLLLPVKKITADVEEISAQNLARRLKTGATKDEWWQLSNTLNRLLNRLQESFELQRRFISNASHELSTPLTSISSQLEVSLQREREAKDYREVMQSIYQDVRHMSKLVQTLLEFAKASGSTAGLEIEPVRIDEIMLRMPAEMAKVNSSYAVSLNFVDLPEDETKLLVFGNEALLFTAIRNIVLNACKYSGNHQATGLLYIQHDKIIVEIKDTGKGIPESKLQTIFQPFYRVEENIATEGFGLGLSLAERIIKLHKGTVEVSSAVNIGSTFTIILPTAPNLSGAEF
jgi:two-component system, OmpR family, sensor histidine kinase ArlS